MIKKQIGFSLFNYSVFRLSSSTADYILQFCNEFAVPKDKQEHFKDITPQDIVCSQVAKQKDFIIDSLLKD